MRRALGKGLSQLIADQFETGPTEVALDAIVPNARQPRRIFRDAALEELASSLREHGVLQPLVVRPLSEGRYELIAGERRLRAAKLAGLSSVPIILRSADNQTSLEWALIENIQREDIGPLECALAYRQLIQDFGLTQEQVADKVGKARTSVANTLRLLRLPTRIQDGLSAGRITEGHARALLSFDDEAKQVALYDQILEKGLTVRDVEKATRPAPAPIIRQPKLPQTADPNWIALQEALSTTFGAPTKIERADLGGRIVIEFFSDDDLDRILEQLGISL